MTLLPPRFGKLLLALALLSSGIIFLLHNRPTSPIPASEESKQPQLSTSAPKENPPKQRVQPAALEADRPPQQPLSLWLDEWTEAPSPALLEKGKEIAATRQTRMRELIVNEPEQAIANMLSFRQYQILPKEIAQQIESPFSVTEDITVIPACVHSGESAPGSEHHHRDYYGNISGKRVQLYPPNSRRQITSQKRVPISGIRIDDVAAIRSDILYQIPAEESLAAITVLGLNYESLPTAAFVTVSGDSLLRAEAPDELPEINQILAYAETQPGPTVLQSTLNAIEQGTSSFAPLSDIVDRATKEWTTTDKDVLFVKVKFEDSETISLPNLSDLSLAFEQASFGKTRFKSMSEATISLDKKKSSYHGENAYLDMHDDVQKELTEKGYNLESYDFIGISFPHIATYTWSGRAELGGTRLWLNGNDSFAAAAHEFGHTYGLAHVSLWNDPRRPFPNNYRPYNHPTNWIEYGDELDTMGALRTSQLSFGAIAKYRLHWIDADRIYPYQIEENKSIRIYSKDSELGEGDDFRAVTIPGFEEYDWEVWLSYFGSPASEPQLRIHLAKDAASIVIESPIEEGASLTLPDIPVNISVFDSGNDGRPYLDLELTYSRKPIAITLIGPEQVTSVQNYYRYSILSDEPDFDEFEKSLKLEYQTGSRSQYFGRLQIPVIFKVPGTHRLIATCEHEDGRYGEAQLSITATEAQIDKITPDELQPYTFNNVSTNDGHYFAFTDNSVSHSSDAKAWTSTALDFRPYSAAHQAETMLLLGTRSIDDQTTNVLSHSTDGSTWTDIDFPAPDIQSPILLSTPTLELLIGDKTGRLWQYRDAQWHPYPSIGAPVQNIVATKNSILALTDDGTILEAKGDLTSWNQISIPPEVVPQESQSQFSSLGISAGAIFAQHANGAIFSHDQGNTWHDLNFWQDDTSILHLIWTGQFYNLYYSRIEFEELRYYKRSIDIWGTKWLEEQIDTTDLPVAIISGQGQIVSIDANGKLSVQKQIKQYDLWEEQQLAANASFTKGQREDPDQDGLVNLLEYIANTNPMQRTRAEDAPFSIALHEEHPTLAITLNNQDLERRYTLQTSEDLQDWTSYPIDFENTWTMDEERFVITEQNPIAHPSWKLTIKDTFPASSRHWRLLYQ